MKNKIKNVFFVMLAIIPIFTSCGDEEITIDKKFFVGTWVSEAMDVTDANANIVQGYKSYRYFIFKNDETFTVVETISFVGTAPLEESEISADYISHTGKFFVEKNKLFLQERHFNSFGNYLGEKEQVGFSVTDKNKIIINDLAYTRE